MPPAGHASARPGPWRGLAPPLPAPPAPSAHLTAPRSPLPLRSCSHSLWAPGRPAAREAADAQPAAVGEPAPRPRDARLGAEGAGAAAPGAAGAAERGVGEGGRHHPAGGPGHHRPPDRGLSGRATEDGPQGGARARAAATPPRPRALGGRPDRGPQSWDQSQSEGQEVAAAPVAQGSRRPEAPRTLPSSDPAPAGGRAAAADHGQAGCGRLSRTPAQAAATKDQPARPSRPGTVF